MNYFTKIEFPTEEEPQKEIPIEPDWPEDKYFDVIIEKIERELQHIQAGTSPLSTYAIDFTVGLKKTQPPIFEVFDRFKEDRTKQNMKSFLQMIETDVNLKCRRRFAEWLNTVIQKEK